MSHLKVRVRKLMWHRKQVVEGRTLDKQRTGHYVYHCRSFSMKKCQAC